MTNRLSRILFGLALLLLAAASLGGQTTKAPPLTVRVESKCGAPRIVVNGRPVRARMFWGAPGSGLITLKAGAQNVEFEFTPSQCEPSTATMHFRFGRVAGDVYLDDLAVTDIDTGRGVIPFTRFEEGEVEFTREWNIWPPDAQNTVGTVRIEPGAGRDGSTGLHIHLNAPPNGIWPDFHIHHNANLGLVAGHRYRVRFWARAEPARELLVAFYKPGDPYVHLGGPPGHFESQIRQAARAGVNFVSCEVPMPWPKPGEPVDWTSADTVCNTVLRANPRALILPRIGLYAPAWWLREHPDDMMLWENGKHQGIASVASRAYRQDAARNLAALIRHLEAKFGNRMAGYHPTGQNTAEWFYMDSWEHPLNGYGRCEVAAWRSWLRSKYRTDEALRTAWQSEGITLESAAVPSPQQRHSAPFGVFRDPVRERQLIDFNTFQQETMADCVLDFARVVRRETAGRKLVVFFFGYLFEFGGMPTGPASSGHYALRKLLDSPDIDVLCSPISYFDRGPGQSAPSMTAAESVALAGKMWLNEDDTRTHLTCESDFPGSEHVVTTLAQTNGELVRNVAQEALRNFATWWMDLPGTGWFDDPGMWAEMARLRRLDEPLLRNPMPFHPEIAAVIDALGALRLAEGADVVGRPAIYESRAALGRSGAPYGQYMLEDVANGKVDARLFFFLNAWSLDAPTRTRLLNATLGRFRVWSYAPGWFDGYRTSPGAMRALTGFDLRQVSSINAWASPTALGVKLGLTKSFGVQRAINPLFSAVDARSHEILATYPDGSAAIALRKLPTGPSLFVGVPGLTPELVRMAARLAGVHLFAERDCNVYASGHYVVVHAAEDGPIGITFRQLGQVRDVLTGERIGAGRGVTLKLKRGETRILQVNTHAPGRSRQSSRQSGLVQ